MARLFLRETIVPTALKRLGKLYKPLPNWGRVRIISGGAEVPVYGAHITIMFWCPNLCSNEDGDPLSTIRYLLQEEGIFSLYEKYEVRSIKPVNMADMEGIGRYCCEVGHPEAALRPHDAGHEHGGEA